MLERLLDEGAQINTQDERGMTALHHASIGGRRACARVLIARSDCRYDIIDSLGRTAADLAFEWAKDYALGRLLTSKQHRQNQAQQLANTNFEIRAPSNRERALLNRFDIDSFYKSNSDRLEAFRRSAKLFLAALQREGQVLGENYRRVLAEILVVEESFLGGMRGQRANSLVEQRRLARAIVSYIFHDMPPTSAVVRVNMDISAYMSICKGDNDSNSFLAEIFQQLRPGFGAPQVEEDSLAAKADSLLSAQTKIAHPSGTFFNFPTRPKTKAAHPVKEPRKI